MRIEEKRFELQTTHPHLVDFYREDGLKLQAMFTLSDDVQERVVARAVENAPDAEFVGVAVATCRGFTAVAAAPNVRFMTVRARE